MRLLYRIALETGREMPDLLQMSAAEWQGWIGFSMLEPFGPVRDDLRAATAASAAARAGGMRERPADYFDTLRPEPKSRAARAGGAQDRAGFVSRCPALSAVPV